jgi:cytosol alanyl aminopeptidase
MSHRNGHYLLPGEDIMRGRTAVSFTISLLLLLCSAGGALPHGWAATATSKPSAAPIPPALRLDDTSTPTHYALDLTVAPADDTFAGSVEIDLTLRRQTSLLWLNGTELTLGEAHLLKGGRSIPLRAVQGNEDFLGFALDRPVGPGTARLHVAYQGRMPEKEEAGLFRRKEGDHWYAFTKFEPTDARRAFPCFDEPGFKVPWQLTLHVGKDQVALSNTPVLSETEEPNGMKAVRFAETKPLPSYLVAFAVGPFETGAADRVGAKRTPVRIITPRGRASEGRYAKETTPEILARLERYFGTPYPYAKLDLLAVPQVGYAMENPGLVTFSDTLILAKPETQTIWQKRGYAIVCAHELAHQWFGDLVTMAWWNDVWLNEAFATWMEAKIVDGWKPEWNVRVEELARRADVMSSDSRLTARKIRQPIQSKDDIANAFDDITYQKGAAVLEMFEAWMGEGGFRRGIRRYLAKHAWGHATAEEFIAALSEEAGHNLLPAFSTFLDQTGVPVVTVALQCEEGKRPRLALAQSRYLPVGSAGSRAQTWQIPIRIRYDASRTGGRASVLLTEVKADLPLRSARSCPAWVLANAGRAGYYRVRYQGDLLNRLLQGTGPRLTLAERVGIIGDIGALVESGELPAGQALALLPQLLRDANRQVVSSSADLVYRLHNLVPAELRPSYARFARRTYGEQARALGWQRRSGDDDETQLLRVTLLRLAAGLGEDEALVAEGDRLARRWLEDRSVLAPDLAPMALRAAARHGDRALFDRFHAEARKTQDRTERRFLLGAMGAFRDPEILQAAFHITLTDEFRPTEAMSLLRSAAGDPQTRPLAYVFVKQNFDALVARLPRDEGAYLPFLAADFADEAQRADVEASFKDRSTKFTGGPRILDQVLEQIRLNSALKRAQLASLEAFLKP